MSQLLLTSLIWAFSFGLIKGGLAGVPALTVVLTRLAVALAVFAPFMRLSNLRAEDAIRLMLTGAVQYGLMYIAYIHAFSYLQSYEVALFTVFTPVYVTAINDLFERKIGASALAAAVLAAAGGAVIEYQKLSSPGLWYGFMLMQGANLCFAFGQILYRKLMIRLKPACTDLQVFGLLYLGATISAAAAYISTAPEVPEINSKQAGILLYLGVIASGLSFFLWNAGSRKVKAGTLAVFNNLKIPLGILVSVLCFGESADWPRLLGGGILMAAAIFFVLPRKRLSCGFSQNKHPSRLT